MTALTVRADLTADIIAAHEAAFAAADDAVRKAIQCGELLLKAKAEVQHGDFGAFCKALPFGERMAQRYMQAASWTKSNPTRVSEMGSLRGLLTTAAPPNKPKATTSATPVLKTKAQRQLAEELKDPQAVAVMVGAALEEPLTPSESFNAAMILADGIKRAAAPLAITVRANVLRRVMRGLVEDAPDKGDRGRLLAAAVEALEFGPREAGEGLLKLAKQDEKKTSAEFSRRANAVMKSPTPRGTTTNTKAAAGEAGEIAALVADVMNPDNAGEFERRLTP
jgi:hypothetical protein